MGCGELSWTHSWFRGMLTIYKQRVWPQFCRCLGHLRRTTWQPLGPQTWRKHWGNDFRNSGKLASTTKGKTLLLFLSTSMPKKSNLSWSELLLLLEGEKEGNTVLYGNWDDSIVDFPVSPLLLVLPLRGMDVCYDVQFSRLWHLRVSHYKSPLVNSKEYGKAYTRFIPT